MLKSFLKDIIGTHIKIMIDNNTAVSVINDMGIIVIVTHVIQLPVKFGRCVRNMVFGLQQPIFLAKRMLLLILSLETVI